MLLPRIFPTIKSPEPVEASIIVTAASGALVPNATTVTPIIKVETLSFFAIPDAPSTKKSAPLTNRTNPIKSKTTLSIAFPAI